MTQSRLQHSWGSFVRDTVVESFVDVKSSYEQPMKGTVSGARGHLQEAARYTEDV